jgi:hypothetical protein
VAASAAPPATSVPAPPRYEARADTTLLARQIIFGNPERTGPRISPDGKQLGWIAPKDGVLNVYVAPAGDLSKARAVTGSKKRPIPAFVWAHDNQHVLYAIDENGDENVHVFAVHVATASVKDLTPYAKTQGRIYELSERFPTAVTLGMNDRDEKHHDVYRVELSNGKRTLLQQNDGYADFVIDPAFKVRFALKARSDGGLDLMKSDGKSGFSPFQTIPPDDSLTTDAVGFDKSGRTLYLKESRDRGTSALVAFDTGTDQPKLLAEDARAGGGVRLRPAQLEGHRSRARAGSQVPEDGGRRRSRGLEPQPERSGLDGRLRRQRRPRAFLPLRPQEEGGDLPVLEPAGARRREARQDAPFGHPRPRRQIARELFVPPACLRHGGHGKTERPAANGAARARWTLVAR